MCSVTLAWCSESDDKTSTALQRAATTLRLDVPAQLQIVSADPDVALTGKRPVLVDEWHRHPPVWDAVKRAVDRDGAGGQFLLTGSSPVDGPPTHSGAGRIASIRMRPFTLAERGVGVPSVSLSALLRGGRPPIRGTTDVGLRDSAARSLGPLRCWPGCAPTQPRPRRRPRGRRSAMRQRPVRPTSQPVPPRPAMSRRWRVCVCSSRSLPGRPAGTTSSVSVGRRSTSWWIRGLRSASWAGAPPAAPRRRSRG